MTDVVTYDPRWRPGPPLMPHELAEQARARGLDPATARAVAIWVDEIDPARISVRLPPPPIDVAPSLRLR